jgi:hypothetical protein
MTLLRTLLKAAREPLNLPSWRFLLALSCVLVFSFAFHAKLAAYYPSGHIDTSTSSKLWLNGDQAEADTPLSDSVAMWFMSWVALLAVSPSVFYRYQEHRRLRVPSALSRFDLPRYMRPPPRG